MKRDNTERLLTSRVGGHEVVLPAVEHVFKSPEAAARRHARDLSDSGLDPFKLARECGMPERIVKEAEDAVRGARG